MHDRSGFESARIGIGYRTAPVSRAAKRWGARRVRRTSPVNPSPARLVPRLRESMPSPQLAVCDALTTHSNSCPNTCVRP